MVGDSPPMADAVTDSEVELIRKRSGSGSSTELAQLAGGLAHEIRNPLSTMLLNLDLLAEDFAKPETPRETRALQKIDRIRRETLRLQTIVEDFLRLAKVQDLRLDRVALNAVVDDLRDFFEPEAAAAGVVIRVEYEPNLPPLLLDVELFKQAVFNLVLNAVHAMPDGGDLILTTRKEGPWQIFEVTDTGKGILPADQVRVFEPFFSTRKGGTGLGLPLTRTIIEAHGGNIQLWSEPGKGTKFTIKLPAEAEVQIVEVEVQPDLTQAEES